MRWILLSFVFLFSQGNVWAFDFDDSPLQMFMEEEGKLNGEIEDLLDEELADNAFSQKPYSEPTPSLLKAQLKNTESEKFAPVELDVEAVSYDQNEVASLNTIKEGAVQSIKAIEINLKKVFSGAPIIYSVLFILSTVALSVWLYSMMTIRSVDFLPPKLVKEIRTKLISNQFDEALDLCAKQKHFFCKMLASGILARKHGLTVMLDTMKAEGKRSTVAFWQRIGILNEIAIIAPMLGLLGTVLGMFYAFYDLNRSIESVSLLFDGLGISVGTTVAGLLVAILAMILYSLAKYRLVRILANVENETQTFAALIDSSGPNYLK